MIDERAHLAATSPRNDLPEPTEAQKKAGNYKKGLIYLHGMRVSIENPQGSKRSGKSKDGTEWESELKNHYGYIRGSEGRDKDHVDLFLGPDPEDKDLRVYVVDQVDPDTGVFDEHKVMIGFPDADSAADAYRSNYGEDWAGMGAITELPLTSFKKWVFQDGRREKSLSGELKGYSSGGRVAQDDEVPPPAPRDHLAGFYPHLGRRREANNDRTGASELAPGLLRGLAAQAVGLPGDIEELMRLVANLPGERVAEKPWLYGTDHYLEAWPWAPQTARGKTAQELGSTWLPLAAATPALGVAGFKGARALTRGLNAERGVPKGALGESWGASRGYGGGGVVQDVAHRLQGLGRGGDTILAHINPREAALLKAAGGSGRRNPDTGLLSFEMEGDPFYYEPPPVYAAPAPPPYVAPPSAPAPQPYVAPPPPVPAPAPTYEQAVQDWVANNTTQVGSSLEGSTETAPLPAYLAAGYATDPALTPMTPTMSVYNEPLPEAEGQLINTGGNQREGASTQSWQAPEEVAVLNEWNNYLSTGDTAAQELFKQQHPEMFTSTWDDLGDAAGELFTNFILPSLGAYGAVSGLESLFGSGAAASTAPVAAEAIGYGSGSPIATAAGDFLSGAELASGAVAPAVAPYTYDAFDMGGDMSAAPSTYTPSSVAPDFMSGATQSAELTPQSLGYEALPAAPPPNSFDIANEALAPGSASPGYVAPSPVAPSLPNSFDIANEALAPGSNIPFDPTNVVTGPAPGTLEQLLKSNPNLLKTLLSTLTGLTGGTGALGQVASQPPPAPKQDWTERNRAFTKAILGNRYDRPV